MKTKFLILFALFIQQSVAWGYSEKRHFPNLKRWLNYEGLEAPEDSIPSPNLDLLNRFETPIFSMVNEDLVRNKYSYVDTNHLVPEGLLRRALSYYDFNKKNIPNQKYLGVVDYAAHSSFKRFFILNMSSGETWPLHVAHGAGSDQNDNGLLEKVSNVTGSLMSSRGFMLTAETYQGKYGKSLRLDGLSSTNSNLRSRAVVIHGASYVKEQDVQQGMSWGCLALPMQHKDLVIDMLGGGALIYAGISPDHWSDNR